MTRARPLFTYHPGSYDQTHVRKAIRLDDVRAGWLINEWLLGRAPAWLSRQPLGEEGQRLSALAIRAHIRRMHDQGLMPPGSWKRPGQPAYTGKEPTVETSGGLVISQHPGSHWRGEARRGRRTNAQRRMDESLSEWDIPQTMAGVDWREQRRQRLEREARENRAALAGVEPDLEQMAQRRPIDLERLEKDLATPLPTDGSTAAEHEERIRARGELRTPENDATMLQESTFHPEEPPPVDGLAGITDADGYQDEDQEEGTDHASSQARPADQPSDQEHEAGATAGSSRRRARGKPPRARRKPRADRTREEQQRHGEAPPQDGQGTPERTEEHEHRDSDPGH